MTSCGDGCKWDPYETSHKRDFTYRPCSSLPDLRPHTAGAYKSSLADPIGVTAYTRDFFWKTPSKPDYIRTGLDSRNNPHPSQDFMVWNLRPGMKLCENPPSKLEVRKAVYAQYRSTYSTDFLSLHQGHLRDPTRPLQHGDAPWSMQTEMKRSYRRPVQKVELQRESSRYGSNAPHSAAPKGIVPTIVPKHLSSLEKHVTTYERHFGGKTSDVQSVLRSLNPEELQNFYKLLPEKEKLLVRTLLHRDPNPPDAVKDPVVVSGSPPGLERVSVWPGPM